MIMCMVTCVSHDHILTSLFYVTTFGVWTNRSMSIAVSKIICSKDGLAPNIFCEVLYYDIYIFVYNRKLQENSLFTSKTKYFHTNG